MEEDLVTISFTRKRDHIENLLALDTLLEMSDHPGRAIEGVEDYLIGGNHWPTGVQRELPSYIGFWFDCLREVMPDDLYDTEWSKLDKRRITMLLKAYEASYKED